jgi:hypothetical protein
VAIAFRAFIAPAPAVARLRRPAARRRGHPPRGSRRHRPRPHATGLSLDEHQARETVGGPVPVRA